MKTNIKNASRDPRGDRRLKTVEKQSSNPFESYTNEKLFAMYLAIQKELFKRFNSNTIVENDRSEPIKKKKIEEVSSNNVEKFTAEIEDIKPQRRARMWLESDIELIKKLRDKELKTIEEIADTMERNATSVSAQLASLYSAGIIKTQYLPTEEFNNNGRKYTEDVIDTILTQRREGNSFFNIGKLIGRSESAVIAKYYAITGNKW